MPGRPSDALESPQFCFFVTAAILALTSKTRRRKVSSSLWMQRSGLASRVFEARKRPSSDVGAFSLPDHQHGASVASL